MTKWKYFWDNNLKKVSYYFLLVLSLMYVFGGIIFMLTWGWIGFVFALVFFKMSLMMLILSLVVKNTDKTNKVLKLQRKQMEEK